MREQAYKKREFSCSEPMVLARGELFRHSEAGKENLGGSVHLEDVAEV